MLIIKFLVCIAPDVNLEEHTSCMPLETNVRNKADPSGLETRRRNYLPKNSKTRLSVEPQKDLCQTSKFQTVIVCKQQNILDLLFSTNEGGTSYSLQHLELASCSKKQIQNRSIRIIISFSFTGLSFSCFFKPEITGHDSRYMCCVKQLDNIMFLLWKKS